MDNNALDNIIDLNIAVQQKDMVKIKELVPIINSQLDELVVRFNFQDKTVIGDYFGLTDLLLNIADKDITKYVIDNFEGFSEIYKDKMKWLSRINSVILHRDGAETPGEILIEFFNSTEKIKDYQYNGIIRLINLTQKYDLFKKLKEKGEQ